MDKKETALPDYAGQLVELTTRTATQAAYERTRAGNCKHSRPDYVDSVWGCWARGHEDVHPCATQFADCPLFKKEGES